jgi:AbiV family abortive infection protein
MAEENLNKGYDHICFHLALVALEEIGKAILILIGASLIAGQKEDEDFSITIDDHIKKIFWALWGDLLREKEFSKDEIEQVKTYLLHCIIKD